MTLNEYLGTAFDLFTHLANFATFPPMLALLGVAVIGIVIGIIFYFVGGK